MKVASVNFMSPAIDHACTQNDYREVPEVVQVATEYVDRIALKGRPGQSNSLECRMGG